MDRNLLLKTLSYDNETGLFFWKKRKETDRFVKCWNTRYSGNPAMNTMTTNGYLSGRLFNERYLAHRLAWFYVTGNWPDDHVDHINGCRTDNRFENLRSVDRFINQRNRKKPVDNKSNEVGISWHKSTQRWRVQTCGKHIGVFSDFNTAIKARNDSRKDLGFHENHGRIIGHGT